MTLPKHLEEAAARLEEASWRIDQARKSSPSSEKREEWLTALTDYIFALSEVQRLNNESIHEKLHELAERVHLKQFRSAGP